MKQTLKFLFDLGPLVVFLLSWRWGGLFVATGALMGATLVGLTGTYILERKLPLMPIVTAVVVMVFGGLTLYLQDERFIKMKPTIIYGLFAMILLGGLAAGRPLIKFVFGQVFQLTDQGWRQLTFRWGLFFVFSALLNEFIWRNYSEAFWVNFKVWGFTSLTLVFTFWQVYAVQRYIIEPQGEQAE